MESQELNELIEAATKPRDKQRGLPKTREGVVVSDKMEKTLVVSTVRLMKHPTFKKYVRVTKKFHVHDERNEAKIGDRVQIVETRPLSKTKRWRLLKIIQKAV